MYVFDVKWSATTAGPSPFSNERTELFLLGCQKAREGNPCKGCFNSKTWYIPPNATSYSAEESAYNLLKHMPNAYLTIGGGEPLDIIEELIIMCKILKQQKLIHIICYTWRDIFAALNNVYGETFAEQVKELSLYVDVFIDGEFILEKRCYKEDAEDGLLNSIGSTNQHLVIRDKNVFKRYRLDQVESFYCDKLKTVINGRRDNDDINLG